MHGIELLKYALTKNPKRVLDLGVGHGHHAKAFIANGAEVVGVDVRDAPHKHDKYSHVQMPIELLETKEDAPKYDLVWFCHTLEHMPNVQAILVNIAEWLEDDGYLCVAVPTSSQDRLHIGHLTLWTPAHLVYNLICAGWDCREAKWYTSYQTIGLCVQKRRIKDMTWRTGMPSEEKKLNEFSPVHISHECGAWWGNNWPNDTQGRTPDPPNVTIGACKTNLQPQVQLAYGPNPALRKSPGASWRHQETP